MTTTTAKVATTTSAHGLQIEAPSWSDYLKGGYGELVAQCSCSQHEYVSSQQEGHYWHWLHRTNAGARGFALLRLLVDNPMPVDWSEPVLAMVIPIAPASHQARRYTCPTCMGDGSVLIAGGGFGGHFRAYGTSKQAVCPDCSGSGRTERWIA